MDLTTIEEQLKDWHSQKFGHAVDVPKTMRKLGEEFGEFIEAVMKGEPAPIAEEAADVLFVMCHIVRACAGDGALNKAVVAKIGVIYDRLRELESLEAARERDRIAAGEVVIC